MTIQRGNRAACWLVLAATLLVLAGCGRASGGGSAGTPASGTGASDGPAEQTPPRATADLPVLTWNLAGGEPATLDAALTYGGSDLLVDANLCESLLYLSPSGSVEPALATAVDQPDPLTYVIHLRPGVTFTDGQPMTADDVVFSLDRVRDPGLGSYWGFFAQRVKRITATDERTVTIKLSKPDAVFRRMLATPMAQVVQQRYVERMGDRYGSPDGGVMCTGPYELERWDKGDSITLARHAGWWNREERPQRAARVRFRFITDDATVTSALANGDIDGSFDLSRAAIAKLGKATGGTIYMGPSTKQQVLIPTQLENEASPLSNPRLREALAKSLDYDGIVTTFLSGAGEPLRAIMPPGSWGTGRDVYEAAYEQLPAPAQDIEGARRLIAESGIERPEIVIAVPGDIPEYRAIGETIQSNARQVGFEVKLRPLPSAEFNALYSDPEARARVDAFFSDYYADIPDPLELYMQLGVPDGAADFGGYRRPEVARLLEEARGSADEQRRAELTAQAQQRITEDRVWIPITYPYQTLYLKDGIGGATVAFPAVMYWPWLPDVGGR